MLGTWGFRVILDHSVLTLYHHCNNQQCTEMPASKVGAWGDCETAITTRCLLQVFQELLELSRLETGNTWQSCSALQICQVW